MYDASLGRWTTQDPLAEMYESWSPYNYTMNNPVRYIDIDGMYSTEEWMKDNGVTQDDLINVYQAPSDKEESHFDDLWDNYPSKSPKHKDPNGNDIFSDHCAINLSEALIKSGMKLDGYKGTKCWGKCPLGSGSHALRAQELATYLKDVKKLPVNVLTGANFEENVADKTGIIFFKDYWQRSGETGDTRTGDHIDLWNKNELASIGLILTFIRRTFPEISENLLDMSDLRKSKQVLFFEIK